MISARTFQTALLRWFDENGRKKLPWQQNKTPYRVWVSEIMLQQTQVKTVIPYFERFMQRFPNLHQLAQSTLDEVMHLWAGLGYYSRARYLHQTARLLVKHHRGQFPCQLETLQTLPGIGRSTAGAILSIAFNQPTAILDGNVKRVLTRVCGVIDPINVGSTEKTLWQLSEKFTPKDRVADYTQAIMDVGATLCTRTQPQCGHCPFKRYCFAYQHEMVELLPKKKQKRELPLRAASFIILKKNTQVMLVKRSYPGIWGGLWCFPEMEGLPEQDALIQFCRKQWRRSFSNEFKKLDSFRHHFTHYSLDVFPVLIELKKSRKKMDSPHQIWYNMRKPIDLGMPKPVHTILKQLYGTTHSLFEIK